jgi:hypothetical protein
VFLLNFFVLYFALASMSSVGAFISEHFVYSRERDACMYRTPAYVSAKVLCDLVPLRVLPPLLFSLIVFFMVGLHPPSFLPFVCIMVLVNCTCTTFCMYFSVLCGDAGAANLLSAAIFLHSYMFSGFLLAGQ